MYLLLDFLETVAALMRCDSRTGRQRTQQLPNLVDRGHASGCAVLRGSCFVKQNLGKIRLGDVQDPVQLRSFHSKFTILA